MSSPTSELSKLSLGRMPMTRAQSIALQQSGHEEEDSSSEAGSSDLDYDTRLLTPRSKQRFEDSQEGQYELDKCGERREVSGGDGTYYVFELKEITPFSIRIQEPGKKYGSLPCSRCNQESDDPCRHVFWLIDQIAKHTLTESQKKGKFTLTRLGYPSEVPDPYSQISNFGIDKLAENANWEITFEDEEEENPEHQELALRKRGREVREIMAALSPSDTADTYRPDIFNNIFHDEITEQSVVPGDLEATLARILMNKNEIFRHFRGLISSSYCASDFFRKMRDRVDTVLEHMENYFAAGALGDQTGPRDVAWCSSELTKVVASIRNLLLKVKLGRSAKTEAAKTLVYILGEVVNRDRNNYEGPAWAFSQQRLQHDRERNLYHRLVNSTSQKTGSSFILSELDLIDANAAQRSVTELEEIFDKLTAAPSEYKRRFRELLNRWKGPSAQKRAGESSASSPKRRMK